MKGMMAVRKMKPAPGLEMTEAEIPKIGPNDVLIKVKACSLCGTDVHIYKWDAPWNTRVKPPRTLGHEVCGDIVEIGKNVTSFAVGDYISAESHIADGKCFQCRIGNQHICLNMKLLGVDVDGAFAEYVSLPEANLWKNPKNMPPEVATLQESLGNSVYTVYSGDIVGKTVTVFGLGPTGQFAIGLCRVAGATKIIAIGGTKLHLDVAKKMGADVLINRHEEDVIKRIMEETEGIGADVFLEMSGSPEAVNQGLKSLRRGGRVTLLGLPPEEVKLNWSSDVVLKEAHINGIWGRKMFDTWIITSRLLGSGRLDITPIITHKLKLKDYDKAIELAASRQAGKVVMFPK
jgi:threonine 3-dehydrogenase